MKYELFDLERLPASCESFRCLSLILFLVWDRLFWHIIFLQFLVTNMLFLAILPLQNFHLIIQGYWNLYRKPRRPKKTTYVKFIPLQ